MNFIAVLASVAVGVGSFGLGTAMANDEVSPQFFEEVSSLVVRCAVLPVAYSSQGRKISGNLRSTCKDLEVFPNSARFVLNGEVHFAHLFESEFSDGGDLNDLEVTREDGTVIGRKQSVLAYGDVLLALAAPRDDFREEFEPALIAE
jgi:hypothetical protein